MKCTQMRARVEKVEVLGWNNSVVWLHLTHFYRCIFTKNMIGHSPMGTIRKPLDSGSGGSKATAFIQWINGREPQIHELWCLGLDGIICEVRPTARLEVISRTVGDFVTNFLAENVRRIKIIGQPSVIDSVN